MATQIRGKDNFTNPYDYIINQLFIYDYNNKKDADVLKLKLKMLDDAPSSEELSGGDLRLAKTYYVGERIVINTLDSGYKIFSCNTQHITGAKDWELLGRFDSWKVNTKYYKRSYKTKDLYNSNNWIQYQELSVSLVEYQGKYYEFIGDETIDSGLEFDFTQWSEFTTITFWVSNTSYTVNSCVISDGNIYKCISNTTSSSNFFTTPCFYTEYWDEIGVPTVCENDFYNPVNHYDALKNELTYLDYYAKSVTDYKNSRISATNNIASFISSNNPLTNYPQKNYEIPITSRPPIMSDIQFEAIYNLFIIKKNNNELSVPSDILNKLCDKTADSDVKSDEGNLAGYMNPESAKDGVKQSAQSMKKDVDDKMVEYSKAYEEMVNMMNDLTPLLTGLSINTPSSFATPWMPDKEYKVGDIINAPSDKGKVLWDENVPGYSDVDLYKAGFNVTDCCIWVCKSDHNSNLYFPNFDPKAKIVREYNHNSVLVPYRYKCIDCGEYVGYESRIIGDPINHPSLCPSCGGSLIEGVISKTLWIRPVTPNISDPNTFLDYPVGVSGTGNINGIIPLCLYHRNYSNSLYCLDNEAFSSIHPEAYNYNTEIIVDADGDPFPIILVNHRGLVFKLIGNLSTTEAPFLLYGEEPPVDPENPPPIPVLECFETFKWTYEELLSTRKLNYVGVDGESGVYPLDLMFGLALVSQMAILKPQNGCCTGKEPTGANPPKSVTEGPSRYAHELNYCNIDKYEYDSWVGGTCPICGETDVQLNYREELGIGNIPRVCDLMKSWARNMKVHPIFNDDLSPTNAKFPRPPDDLSVSDLTYHDCDDCYGCWIIDGSAYNYPLNKRYAYSFRKKKWINWGSINPAYLAKYLSGSNDYEWGVIGFTKEVIIGDWPDKYAQAASDSPSSGLIPGQTGPDGHTLNDIGIYGLPAEDWANFCFVRYIDDGSTTTIVKLVDRNILPHGTSNPGDKTFERFAVLNQRLRTMWKSLKCTNLDIGPIRMVQMLEDVQIPELKKDLEESTSMSKNKKFEYNQMLKESCPEWS